MKKEKKKAAAFLVSLCLVMQVSVVGTMAYLVTQAETVANTFVPASVPNKITEKFDGFVKNDVRVQNVGDADAYIRVKVIPTWVETDQEGNVTGSVHVSKPVYGVDFNWSYQEPSAENAYLSGSLEQVGAGWQAGADGYYYYTEKVGSQTGQNETALLFTNCKALIDAETDKTPNQPQGYVLSIEILSQSVQADGTDTDGTAAVTKAWGVEVNTDGTLKIGGE